MASAHMALAPVAVDDFVSAGNSCPDLCAKYDVDIREFVILACLKALSIANAETLQQSVGLSPTTVRFCLANLLENGLVLASADESQLRASTDGLALLRKAGGLLLE